MAKKENSESSKKGKKSGLGLALFVLAVLVLLILFIKNWSRITTNLKQTGFLEKTVGKNPEFIEKVEVVPSEDKNDVAPMENMEIYLTEQAEEDAKNEGKNNSGDRTIVSQNETAERQKENAVKESKEIEKTQQENKKAAIEKEKAEKAKQEAQAVKTMDLKLYFIVVNSDGTISRKEVTRRMKKTDGPLVSAINALIEGPDASEEKLGCRSVISKGTRLISASIDSKGIAVLNFSSEFEFNQFGIEGTRGQLQQIVFTATAFPTVNSVQFLIDGELKDFLGQEGVCIARPLNRNDF